MHSEMRNVLASLAEPATRLEGARALARMLGSDDMIIFVPDAQLGTLLPAFGFPQTLPGGRIWRSFIERCTAGVTCVDTVRSPFTNLDTTARGYGCTDSSLLVLLGGSPDDERVRELLWIVPILALAYRGERAEVATRGQIEIARDAAMKAQALAGALDEARVRLQKALAQAEAATRAQHEFLAVVSHELRTPLTAILGWTRILREGEDDATVVDVALDTIERNVRAQTTLVDDILDYTRVVSGKLRIEPRQVDLAHVVSDAIKAVSAAAAARHIAITRHDVDTPVHTLGDHDRLVQVMTNLLSNAIKFTPELGAIDVRMTCSDRVAQISVSDTGMGIAPSFLPYVFDRFRQADATSTRRHGGLGLGLAIVRQLVELHSGTVAVESEGEGMGSTFHVRLPIAEFVQHLDDQDSRPPENQGQRLDGVHILLVEDYFDSREFLVFALQQYGAEVTATESGPDALRAFEERAPDVIVSDIELPGMDGYELIRRIRAQQTGGARTPALALSAHTRLVDRAQMLAAGFDLHLGKPVDPSALATTIASLIESSRPKSIST